jgi:hypothetical protein
MAVRGGLYGNEPINSQLDCAGTSVLNGDRVPLLRGQREEIWGPRWRERIDQGLVAGGMQAARQYAHLSTLAGLQEGVVDARREGLETDDPINGPC